MDIRQISNRRSDIISAILTATVIAFMAAVGSYMLKQEKITERQISIISSVIELKEEVKDLEEEVDNYEKTLNEYKVNSARYGNCLRSVCSGTNASLKN